MSQQPDLSGLFDVADPLANMTAAYVGAEIAGELELPAVPVSPLAQKTGELLESCRVWILRYAVVSDDQAIIMAAWLLHSYAPDAAETTPYIHITAPEKACGKSRLMDTLEALAANPRLSGGMTAAALVRCIDQMNPTIFLDEMDAQMNGDKEYAEAIRGILNIGFKKGGRFAKCDGKNHDLREFNAYCPKCFAGIGKLPDTVSDRSIIIEMRRKLPDESVEPFRQRAVKVAAKPIRANLETWAKQGAVAALEHIQPAPLAELKDRQNDIAEPLLCIALLAGRDWLPKLSAALLKVFKAASGEDGSNGVTLLGDIRSIFEERNADRIMSKELAASLVEMEGRAWAEWSHGKPMTANNLARQLKKYGIGPEKIRFSGETQQGYHLAAFQEAWKRYCPQPVAQPEQTEQAASSLNETPFSQTEHNWNISPANGTFTRTAPVADVPFVPDVPDVPFCSSCVPVAESASNQHEQRGVPLVPVGSRGDGIGEVKI